MVEIIGVRFKGVGKIYYFSPEGVRAPAGHMVVVETSRGTEIGEVAVPNRVVDDKTLRSSLRPILRLATKDDMTKLAAHKARRAELMRVFEEKVLARGLSMKPVDAEISFDESKILFYFSAESRVDFRELVKDLAGTFRSRIELRQIGVRDEAKMLGGLGICGRALCCSSFLGEFQPVSIKMAKEQSLSLNPVKISGTCGRLMCCLKYEQEAYEDLLKITPKVGAFIETAEHGRGVVEEVNLLTGVLKVRLQQDSSVPPVLVKREDAKVIKDGQIRLKREELEALKDLE